MKRIVKFIQECIAELKKVSWPSRDEVASSTKIVILSVILIALALGLIDIILLQFSNLIFSLV